MNVDIARDTGIVMQGFKLQTTVKDVEGQYRDSMVHET